jgi:predicted dehydrogenase
MRVAGIVTADPERHARASEAYPSALIAPNPDALFTAPDQLDLVVVAAPNRAHASLGIAALQSGLPVVIDKPFASSSAEAERVMRVARETGTLLTVFQNRRWDNDFLTLRRLIADELLGPVVRLESRFERFRPHPRPDAWRERPAPDEGGGLLFDLGAHLIDQARLLFGHPISVYAESDLRRAGAQVDDDTFVALRFAGGQVAHLWMSVIPRQSGPRFRVVGLRGVYERHGLDPQEDALSRGMRPGDPGWGMETREHWGRLSMGVGELAVDGVVETLPGSYETFYALLRDALIAGGPPPVDPADSLAVLRIIEAARESARTGQTVSLAPPS